METEIAQAVNTYGFPVIAAAGLAYFVYYVWSWATTTIAPVVEEATSTLSALIDRIRLLDNDLIRLNQKVDTVLQLRGERIEKERMQAELKINHIEKEDPNNQV
jgi:hypothetical protein